MAGPDLQQLNAAALALHRDGRLDEAEAAYKAMLPHLPGAPAAAQAGVHYNLAVLLRDQGRLEEAVRAYREAARLRPGHARTHNNLGVLLQRLGRLDEAEADLRRAMALDPSHAGARYNLGNVLAALRRDPEAEVAYAEALRIAPDDADALTNLAMAQQRLGRFADAQTGLRRAIALRPGHAAAHDTLGVLLLAADQAQAAVERHERAVALDPGRAAYSYNLAVALARLERLAEAEAAYRRALAADPAHAEACNNLGLLLFEQGRADEALGLFLRAQDLKPDYAEAHWNEARLRLSRGEMEEGWRKAEWRRRLPGFHPRRFDRPPWDGAPLEGRTLLLHAEQGLGDTLQFARYAQAVHALGARVILECQPALASLMRTAPGVAQATAQGEPLPDFDVHAPLMSMPRLVGAPPASGAYLSADPARVEAWRARLGPGPHVGLAWRGDPRNSEDRRRSIPIGSLEPLLAARGIGWISLQVDMRLEEHDAVGGLVRDVGDRLTDWGETAALMAALDAVVAVDTAVAHLAGALGRPSLVLLSSPADWRWLEGRDDSPWYPAARLLRQGSPGDWSVPLAAARADLESRFG